MSLTFEVTEKDGSLVVSTSAGNVMSLSLDGVHFPGDAKQLRLALARAAAPKACAEAAELIARAEAAEKRVKELEHNAEMARRMRGNMAGRIVEQAQFLVDAKRRITQLEADLAAARTVQAHKLVADVVAAARHWLSNDDVHANRGLEQSALALRDAGITVAQVRTYTREEAEALAGRLKEAAEFVGSHQGGETASETRALSEALDAVESALMSAPVAPAADTDRVKRLEAALRELHAQVKGECPSLLNEDSGGDGALDVEICDLLQPVATRAPKPGADEAGGEGLAAAPLKAEDLPVFELPASEPDEVERLLVEAESLVTHTLDPALPLASAIRILNARK